MRGRIIPHLKSKYTTLLSMGVTSLKRISRAREDIALIDIFNLVGRKKIVKGDSAFSAVAVIDNPAAIVKAVVVAGRGDEDYPGGIFGVVFKNI